MTETARLYSSGIIRLRKQTLKELGLVSTCGPFLAEVRQRKLKDGTVITCLLLLPAAQTTRMLVDDFLREG